MSLAEQTARVAGGGKNALKKILQKLGVTVGDVPIDQYADLADQISDKLLPDNLLDAEVAGLYELPSSAVVKDVLRKIGKFIPTLDGHATIFSGSYVGDGSSKSKNIVFQNPVKIFFISSMNPGSNTNNVFLSSFWGSKYGSSINNDYAKAVDMEFSGNSVTANSGESSYANVNVSGVTYLYLGIS